MDNKNRRGWGAAVIAEGGLKIKRRKGKGKSYEGVTLIANLLEPRRGGLVEERPGTTKERKYRTGSRK